MKKILSKLLLLALLFLALPSLGQYNIQSGSQLAFKYFRDKEYKPASTLFYDLYNATKSRTYFNYYVDCLIALEEYKDAESYVKRQIRKNPTDKSFLISLGFVYKQWGQMDAAKEQYEKAIQRLNPVKTEITNIANAFLAKREYAYAIQTYQKGRQLMKQNHMFHMELANVYLYQKDFKAMVDEYLLALAIDPSKLNAVQNRLQSALLQDIDNSLDPILINGLLNKVQIDPNNIAYKELLQWYYMQKKDFKKAWVQARSIDLIKKEDGYRMLALAKISRENKDYETAIQCYHWVMEKGEAAVNYSKAKMEELETTYLQLVEKSGSKEEWTELSDQYRDFLQKSNPLARLTSSRVRYAHILAIYLHQEDKAIEQLEAAMKIRGLNQQDRSILKMELADIKLFADEKWDAILLYSQLEKSNKNNPLGYEAKFKKARVSYFLGEVKWAKAQLDALKGSTSKLIANDAIALSQLISDNTALDTSYQAMKMYAEAEFLLYQNKREAAMSKLDELMRKFPAHSLMDEAYYKKYEIELQQKHYDEAVANLDRVIEDYASEVLADKALFQKAILKEELGDESLAADCYKKILTDYPDSIFSIPAREKLNRLRIKN